MNQIYKEIRRCYKLGHLSCLSVREFDDGDVAVYSASGNLLGVFASRQVAENEIAAQQVKAAKFI
jgi:hypothetical protein